MTPDDEYHSEVEIGHGRIHERHCRVFYGVDRISGIGKFSGVCAVVEVTTHTTYKATGEETSQTRYYITSLRGSARMMDYISRKHLEILRCFNLLFLLKIAVSAQRFFFCATSSLTFHLLHLIF